MVHRFSSLAVIFVLIAGLFGAAAQPAAAAALPEPAAPPSTIDSPSFWVFLMDPGVQEAAGPGGFETAFAALRGILEQAREDGALSGYTALPDGFAVRLDGPTPWVLQQISKLPGVEAVLSEELGLEAKLTSRFSTAAISEPEPVLPDFSPQEVTQPVSLTTMDGAPLADAAAGKFTVYLYSQLVEGYTVVPGSSVRVVLTRAGVTLADVTRTSDTVYGMYQAFLPLPYTALNGIEPGDTIAVTETGQSENLMTIPEAWVTINTVSDTVAGAAFPNAPVRFMIGGTFYDGAAGADGMFSIHSGTDINRFASTMYVFSTDPVSGDEIIISGSAPSFDVQLFEDKGACGTTGKWGRSDPIMVNRYIDGELTDTVEAEFSYVSTFCAEIADLLPGQRLTAEMPGGETMDFTIPPLTATLNPTDDSIVGTALPDVTIQARATDSPVWGLYSFTIQVDGSGKFHYDVTDFDLSGQDQVTLFYQNPDGHMVLLSRVVATAHLSLTDDSIFLRGNVKEPFAAQLISAGGQLLASANGVGSSTGYHRFTFPRPGSDLPYPLTPGDRLVITAPDGLALIDLVIPPLRMSPDMEADTVTIETMPGTTVHLNLDQMDLFSYSSTGYVATTDPSGLSTISVAPRDLKYSDRISVTASLTSESSLETNLYLGSQVRLFEAENYAYVQTNRYSDLTAQLLAPGGSLKRELTTRTDEDGFAFLGTLGDMVPGDTLRLTVSGQTSEIPVRELSIVEIDRAGNYLTGKTSPGLEVAGSTMNAPAVAGVADDTGSFSLDFSHSTRPLLGGQQLAIWAFDRTTGARQILNATIPFLEMDWTENRLSGAAPMNSSVVAHLYDSANYLLETLVTHTYGPSYLNWSVYFSRRVSPGDRIQVILGDTQTLEFSPPALELSYDKEADTVSGSGPSGETVELGVSKSGGVAYQYYTDEIAIGESGNFLVDLSNEMDINALTWLSLDWSSAVGDRAYFDVQVPGFQVWIDDPYANYIDSGLGEQVTFRLKNAAGALKGEQSVRGYSDGASLEGICAAGKPLSYLPGDILEAGGAGYSVVFPDLKAEIDTTRDRILISGPADASVGMVLYQTYGVYGRQSTFWDVTSLDNTGKKEIDPELDLLPGDLMYLYWEDDAGNLLVKTSTTTSANGLSARLTGYPATARPHSILTLNWETLSSFSSFGAVGVYYDTQSHACDHNYRNSTWGNYWSTGNSGKFQIETPAGGTLYVSMYSDLGGHMVWAPEIAIKVADIAPVIVEPVSGITNQRQPAIYGYAAPGAQVDVFEGATRIETITADEDGYWETRIYSPLSNGKHTLKIQSGGRSSAPVTLDVQPGLWINPNLVRFASLETSYFPRDAQGQAAPGGSLWVRPGEQRHVSIPVTCPTPSHMPRQISLLVGEESHPLYYSYGSWQAAFKLPASDSQISVRLQCGLETRTILLAQTQVYTDGFIASQSGWRVENAQVTLLKKDPQTGEFYAWDAITWNEYNPRNSYEEGWYDFQPEAGVYRLLVEDDDHEPYTSPDITHSGGPIRYNVTLSEQHPAVLYMPMVGYRK